VEVEKKVQANRSRITSGHFMIKVDLNEFGLGRTGTHEFFFDKDRYRIDSRTKKRGAETEIYQSGVVRGNEQLFYMNEGADQTVNVLASRSVLRPRFPGGKGHPYFPKPAIQHVGLNTLSLLDLRHEDFSGLIGNMRSVNETSINREEKFLRLMYSRDVGDATIWIDPKRNFEVVKIEKDYEPYFRQIILDLKEIKGFGYFPREFTFKQESRNKTNRTATPSIQTQHCEIEVISINEPLDDELFTFKAMGVPVGHPITDQIEIQTKEMSASGPTIPEPKYTRNIEPRKEVPRSPFFTRTVLVLNGIFFLIIAALLYWKYLRTSQQQSSQPKH